MPKESQPINVTNIAEINIVLADRAVYHNGGFIPVFQKELESIVINKGLTDKTLRVLVLILCYVDENNRISISGDEMSRMLNCNRSTIYRALNVLVKMNVICKSKSDSRVYVLRPQLLNPRLAFKGNTKRLLKENLPLLMAPDGETLLLPDAKFIEAPNFLFDQEPELP